MADRITLTGLAVFGHHGVFDHEKRDGQTFLVDITLWLDLIRPPRDRRPDAERCTTANWPSWPPRIVAGPPRDLIEAVAGEIADAVMRRYPVHAVEVTIHKPSAPIPLTFADVSVTIRRSVARGRRPACGPETGRR